MTRDKMFAQTKAMLGLGFTVSEIARRLDCRPSTISEVKRTLKRLGEVPDSRVPMPISLARVSILEADLETDEVDFRLGKLALHMAETHGARSGGTPERALEPCKR